MKAKISVTLNGEAVEVGQGSSLGELLAQSGVHSMTGLACERNGEILVPAQAASCTLVDGDEILLVRMVGGG